MRFGSPLRISGRAALAGLLVLPILGGCASWSRTRQDVIDPIHALLHHEYPEALQSMDPQRLLGLFSGTAREDAARPSLELLARFAEIAEARAMIDKVGLDAEPVRARVSLQVEGVGADGQLLSVLQDKEFILARGEFGWRIAADAPTPIRVTPTPDAHFVDETQIRGLRFEHEAKWVPDPQGDLQRRIYGSGVAVADVDNDGWEDVLLVNGDRIELFLNDAGYFTGVSGDWGLGERMEGALTVPLLIDVDNDGRKDLFVGAEFAQPSLFRNEGGRFVRVENSGIRAGQRTVSASAADFDADGYVDFFLANHEDVFWEAPDPPGAADNAQADQLYLNNGDGTFRDATDEAGVGNTGWSLAPAAADYDLDGDVDLFIGNDFGEDTLYRNDGSARFEEVTDGAGVNKPVASMSADWGDFDGDGDLDLFVGGMTSGSAWVLEAPDFRVARVPLILDLLFRPYVREAIRAWFRGNRFYENLGDGSFREISARSGAQHSGWSWGSVWLDFDNDGRLDIYASNGFLSGPIEDDL